MLKYLNIRGKVKAFKRYERAFCCAMDKVYPTGSFFYHES